MIERLLILLVVAAAIGGIGFVWQQYRQKRFRRLAEQDLPATLLGRLAADRPAVLYFTTEQCAQCRLQQTPILEQLRSVSQVAVHAIDAIADAEVAKHFGIMTVPTTVILDHNRRAQAINHGLATLPTLQAQLSTMQ